MPSNWCFATSLPPWSKIMNRVLVVPWSTAPMKSAMFAPPLWPVSALVRAPLDRLAPVPANRT
ncbi:hypothetical protein SVIOM342S_09681 [Streptomyces violaceorubidus]